MEVTFLKKEILDSHRNQLLHILEAPDEFANYSLRFDFLKLFNSNPDLGYHVLNKPLIAFSDCDQALVEAQKCILENDGANSRRTLTLKSNIHARFDLPFCPEIQRNTVPKNEDVGCFLRLTGTAVRMTQSKMLEYRKDYKCAKCQHVQSVEGKYENRYVVKAPTKCKNLETRCRSSTFHPINNISRDNCKDYQEMKLQEQVSKFTVGGIPASIWVTLEDDLVDCCKPGDDVNISGVIMKRWYPLVLNKKCEVEIVVKANYVEVCNSHKSISLSVTPNIQYNFNQFWISNKNFPMRGRDIILASICPKVYGLYMVKLALTLTVITGCNQNFESTNVAMKNLSSNDKSYESSVRGQCHLLMVGDPGTGKSQLLKAAAMLTPRSVLTSGSGTTKAGLTCTALREDGEWQLEAGALVLADGGTCCIDELAQMKEHDRASIHEAMEQQTISVAKAGIVCKLNSRCAVVAACNPKGKYDTEQPLNINVSLGTPLLSRFDLIFLLLDKRNEEWDTALADYILFNKESNNSIHLQNWHLEKLQAYLSLVGRYEVKMTPSATSVLQAYYMSQRRSVNRDPSRTTVRMLDSLIRLSQAHAKLMFRKIVLPMDAIVAVNLMDLSMQDCLFSGSSNVIQTTFHDCPDFIYLKTAKTYLTHFGLNNIWENELLFYAQLLQTDKQTLSHNIENDNFELFKCASDISITNEVNDVIESTYFKNETNHILENEFFHRDKHLYIKPENISHNSEKSFEELLLNDEIEHECPDITIKENVSLNISNEKNKVKNKSKVKFQLDSSDDTPEIERNPKKRKKSFSPKVPRKQKKLEIEDSSESQKEGDVDNLQMLNCVPSVNDIYKELNISFDVCDEDSPNESSAQSAPNDDKILKESFHQPEAVKVKSSAFDKLKGFSFTSRKKTEEQKETSISEAKTSTQNDCVDIENVTNEMNTVVNHANATSQHKKNENIPNTLPPSANTFHTSMFESDENFDELDL